MSQVKIVFYHSIVGLLFGIVLTKVGFANYDELFYMFSLTDFRMLFSFAGGVALAMMVFLVFHRQLPSNKKITHPGIVPGSVLFGVGWVMCGACPSVVFLQLGQGKAAALMTVLGMYIGIYAYKKIHARYLLWDTGVCGT
jgi:uncharacterized membrane protein YedE/YeeE